MRFSFGPRTEPRFDRLVNPFDRPHPIFVLRGTGPRWALDDAFARFDEGADVGRRQARTTVPVVHRVRGAVLVRRLRVYFRPPWDLTAHRSSSPVTEAP